MKMRLSFEPTCKIRTHAQIETCVDFRACDGANTSYVVVVVIESMNQHCLSRYLCTRNTRKCNTHMQETKSYNLHVSISNEHSTDDQ
jgi:hypothetical protein